MAYIPTTVKIYQRSWSSFAHARVGSRMSALPRPKSCRHWSWDLQCPSRPQNVIHPGYSLAFEVISEGLTAADLILEHLREEHAFGTGPWD
jgi:hypothetical protein